MLQKFLFALTIIPCLASWADARPARHGGFTVTSPRTGEGQFSVMEHSRGSAQDLLFSCTRLGKPFVAVVLGVRFSGDAANNAQVSFSPGSQSAWRLQRPANMAVASDVDALPVARRLLAGDTVSITVTDPASVSVTGVFLPQGFREAILSSGSCFSQFLP